MKPHSLEEQVVNFTFLEQLYYQYQLQPAKLDKSWQQFFQEIEARERIPSLPTPAVAPPSPLPEVAANERFRRIERLIEAYRHYGHRLATINSLVLEKPIEPVELNLEALGFQPNEQNTLFPTLHLLPQAQAPLYAIVDQLKKHYCQSIGFEFKGLADPSLEQWIQQQIESGAFDTPFSPEEKRLILELLDRAEFLETFIHTKHVGKKRFSLEGGETLIPMLVLLTMQGAKEAVREIFIGMAHRGRLNVLANVLNKSFYEILKDFDEDYEPTLTEGLGDVRYHKGHFHESARLAIKLTMASNPSHLESVDPVIEGQTRAKQFLVGDEPAREHILPLLIHGDASVAAQGIVYETLQLSKLSGYETGGTIHIVINNQIGFTTSPQEGRSTPYCTDIAHAFGVPVFHVNAEDPEACVHLALLVLDIRQRFHSEVFIDLNCYRKYGHNEGDEPTFTQPLEYQTIRKKRSIRELYRHQLLQEGVIEEKVSKEHEEQIKKKLQEAYARTQEKLESSDEETAESLTPPFSPFQVFPTQVDLKLLQTVTERFSVIPSDFHIHPKLEYLVKERARAVREDKPLDWGLAEYLAYATLLWEGIPVRLSGQDSGRGTFSHRHARWVDQKDGHSYDPLAHLRPGQGQFEVLNSCLSEAAVLGFEYGYSTICTQGLTIWEAQFGDFANGAQVIIDQYIVSGEQKWGQTSNLVLYLPHGFEGQGPEHSSARLERFLTLAGHENIQIVYPTTPAQLFHLLRRQMKQPWSKPLIILTPKGLLRHQACVSHLSDLTEGTFHFILEDPQQEQLQEVKRVVLCSGRIYYDLESERMKTQRRDIAIIRIEQLYPLDEERLKELLVSYHEMQECLWVQDEPENMGAWSFISSYVPPLLPAGISLSYIGRERSASPATGFYARHKQEEANLLHQVFHT